MSHLLIIGFANEQKAKEGADKLLTLKKRGQIEIEDALIATKSESGAVALTQLSNASSFWGGQSRGERLSRPTGCGRFDRLRRR